MKPLCTAGVAAQAAWAREAASTAASTSAAADRATVNSGVPSCGERFSKVAPEIACLCSPLIQFPMVAFVAMPVPSPIGRYF